VWNRVLQALGVCGGDTPHTLVSDEPDLSTGKIVAGQRVARWVPGASLVDIEQDVGVVAQIQPIPDRFLIIAIRGLKSLVTALDRVQLRVRVLSLD